MKHLHSIVLVCAIGCVACACGKPANEKTPQAGESRPMAATKAAQPANAITVSDEMMRDLRITTMPVEQRRGGTGRGEHARAAL